MAASAKEGCPECIFFLRSAELRWGHPPEALSLTKDEIRISLTRDHETDTRVNLHYLEDDWDYIVPLRLCSTYGHEPLPSAECEESDRKFLGRLICPNSGDPECLDLATSWMEKCLKHHGVACRPLERVLLPTRLVYIPRAYDEKLQLRITEGLTGRYIALSYCWGAGMTYKTTSTDFNDTLNGFDAGLLPKTLQDAIIVIRKLGFEYIWIDTLCVIQRDIKDWARESSGVSQVYGNASLTLSADIAGSSDFGLFQPRKITYSHNFGPNDDYRIQTRAVIYAGIMGWDRVSYENLGRRGWALQKRVLSWRILHFLDEQLAWECNTIVYMEEIRGRQIKQDEHFAISRYSKFLKSPSALNTGGSEKSQNVVRAEDQEYEAMLRINAWLGIVQESSIRDFTVYNDKLPSLSGLASAIELPYLGNYLAGMWENYALICMSWFPRYPHKPNSRYRAPSWSWAAIEGQIMGYYKTWEYDSAEKHQWYDWFSGFGPSIIEHHIVPKDPSNPKGEVEEGSYIFINGYHRDIYIIEEPATFCDKGEWMYIRSKRQKPKFPRKVHMDVRVYDSVSYFTESSLPANNNSNSDLFKKLTCLQGSSTRIS